MTQARQILLALSLKYNGDWDKIYEALQGKEEVDVEKLTGGFTTPYITVLDEEYPSSLKQTFKPPFVLFYYGDINLLKDEENNVAIAGTRHPSQEGEFVANSIANHLSDKNVVCGLSQGTETIVLKKAISNGNRPIIVLGSGIDYCYPKSNIDLYNVIKEKGLIVSEYPNTIAPDLNTMPFRKRIISALSKIILCGEFSNKSGTTLLVNYALQQGKDIYVAPMSLQSDSANNELISDGAFMFLGDNYLLDIEQQ